MDNQLPAALARWMAKQGADAVHALNLGLEAVSDTEIWSHGITEAKAADAANLAAFLNQTISKQRKQ